MQLRGSVKLSAVIWLITKHAGCRMLIHAKYFMTIYSSCFSKIVPQIGKGDCLFYYQLPVNLWFLLRRVSSRIDGLICLWHFLCLSYNYFVNNDLISICVIYMYLLSFQALSFLMVFRKIGSPIWLTSQKRIWNSWSACKNYTRIAALECK